jgi:hypothetical protein
MEEIITTVNQKKKEIKKKVFLGEGKKGMSKTTSMPPHITVPTK